MRLSGGLERALPLAVFAGGTHNHFAKDAGVAEFADIATAAPGISFLDTFSLGAYPELVRPRESWEKRVGKPVASLLALAQVLPTARPFTVTAAGQERRMWLLFTGNGVYEPAGLDPPCGGLYSTRACSTCARSAPTTGSPALA